MRLLLLGALLILLTPPSESASVPAATITARPNVTVPHLSGVFLSINAHTARWTKEQWVADLTSMRDVGIEFFCPRAAANGNGSLPTAACPLGGFEAFFPSANPCFHPAAGMPPGGALATVLEAADVVGLTVHLGLAWPSEDVLKVAGRPVSGSYATYYRALAWLEWSTAQELWALYGATHRSTIVGVYTMLEESNTIGEMERMMDLKDHYLEPLARNVKLNLSTELLVWASPYYVMNLTRHPATEIMDPAFYADWWGQMLEWCPHLDLIAPQDSMGANGNSFQNVSDFLGHMKPASQRAGRRLWSNVELFEVWPQNCTGTWAHCTGRHPAPIERIIKQMANEAPLVETLIAWEWHSCLSPNAEDLSYGGVIKQRYEEYLLRGIYMASRSFKLPLFLHPFMAYLLTGAGIRST